MMKGINVFDLCTAKMPPPFRYPEGDIIPETDCGAWWVLPYHRSDLDNPGADPVCGSLQSSH